MKPALMILLGASAWAQEELSLKQAVHLALEKNQSVAAARASVDAAQSRITEARSGRLPKVAYSESWARSDNPVFVFSSLLTQHQFGAENFQIGPLNRPDFLNNFQSLVTVDQTVFDAGQNRNATQRAEVAREIAAESQKLAEVDVIANVVRAYYGAILSVQQRDAAERAVRSAQADVERAQAIRSAGMSTDADVLSIKVHLAAVQEQRIRREADAEVARAALNDAIGVPLDSSYTLSTSLVHANLASVALADYENTSVAERGEAKQAKLAVSLAEKQSAEARSALWPQVSVHGAFEADRQNFYDKGGANWMISAGLRWNLFNGNSDRARIEETKSLVKQSQAEQERAGSAIRLQVRRAYADLRAAEQRIEVAKASTEEAEETLRILQNRYGAGMTNVTEFLRAETAALEARLRFQAAIHDQRIAAVMLEMAAGRLNENSEVLN